MCDAYESSPLWDTYVEHDLLIRNKDGSLRKGGIWDNEQCYLISQMREWKSGFSRKRIDALLDLLPIEEQGTIHIDAHHQRPDPYHGITPEQEVEAIKDIISYWNTRGVDVTHEIFKPELAGMIPYVYHLNMDEQQRLEYPASMVCGGGEGWNMRFTHYQNIEYPNYLSAPRAGCLYEEAWGRSVDEDSENELAEKLIEQFFLRTLPWYIMNRESVVEHVHTKDAYEVRFTGGLRSTVRPSDRYYRLVRGDDTLVDGTDLCVPALWRERECFAFSKDGSEKTWSLPAGMREAARLHISSLNPSILNPTVSTVPVKDGTITLALPPGEPVVLTMGIEGDGYRRGQVHSPYPP